MGIYLNAGTLQVNSASSSAPGSNGATGALGGNAITLNGGTLALNFDGSGTSAPTSTNLTGAVTVNGNATITATRLAAGNPVGSPLFLTAAANQNLQFGALTFNNPGTTLTVTPVSGTGYGVEFTGAVNMNQALTTLLVNTNGTTFSNVTPSLILSGQMTDGNNWTKAGSGTLLLNNLGNATTLTGNVLVTGGILAFTGNSSGSALGAGTNVITLSGGGIEATNAAISTFASPVSSITIGNQINFFGTQARTSSACRATRL